MYLCIVKGKKQDIMIAALKAAGKARREEEIAKYGKTLCYSNVYNSKKKYTRKNKHKNKTDY